MWLGWLPATLFESIRMGLAVQSSTARDRQSAGTREPDDSSKVWENDMESAMSDIRWTPKVNLLLASVNAPYECCGQSMGAPFWDVPRQVASAFGPSQLSTTTAEIRRVLGHVFRRSYGIGYFPFSQSRSLTKSCIHLVIGWKEPRHRQAGSEKCENDTDKYRLPPSSNFFWCRPQKTSGSEAKVRRRTREFFARRWKSPS